MKPYLFVKQYLGHNQTRPGNKKPVQPEGWYTCQQACPGSVQRSRSGLRRGPGLFPGRLDVTAHALAHVRQAEQRRPRGGDAELDEAAQAALPRVRLWRPRHLWDEWIRLGLCAQTGRG